MSSLDADEIGSDIELVSDGVGLVVLGKPSAIERFVTSVGQTSKEIDLRRVNGAIARGGSVAQAAGEVSTQAGRWLKLTEESAQAARLLPTVKRSPRTWQATTRSTNGQFAKNLEFVTNPSSAVATLTNPAVLAGVGGVMAQYAMQQTMEEITEYLAKIDAKLDDVLRAQKDAALADMIGVQLMVDEAMVVRSEVGRVSEVTWSKVQGTAETIARTQAYALLQLDALAEKMESTSKIADLADLAKGAPETVVEWLGVLANSFRLQEALAILELDRVLDSSPEEIDEHRQALQVARGRRLERISTATAQLVDRMDAAASRANAKVLMNPLSARVVVHASNDVAAEVGALHAGLGVTDERHALEARRWSQAAADARDDVVDTGKDVLHAVGRFGAGTIESTRMSTGRLAGRIADRLQRVDRTERTDDSDVMEAPGEPSDKQQDGDV